MEENEVDRITDETFLMIENQSEYSCNCGICQWVFFEQNKTVIKEIMHDMETTPNTRSRKE